MKNPIPGRKGSDLCICMAIRWRERFQSTDPVDPDIDTYYKNRLERKSERNNSSQNYDFRNSYIEKNRALFQLGFEFKGLSVTFHSNGNSIPRFMRLDLINKIAAAVHIFFIY